MDGKDKKKKSIEDDFVKRLVVSSNDGNPSPYGMSKTNFAIKKQKQLDGRTTDDRDILRKKTISFDGITYRLQSSDIRRVQILDSTEKRKDSSEEKENDYFLLSLIEKKQFYYIIETSKHCLLVEIGDVYYIPTSFAVFVPDETTGKLQFLCIVQAETFAASGGTEYVIDPQDPLGLIGQFTYRLNHCSDSLFPWDVDPTQFVYNRLVEQLKRVDQGYLAYDGDSYIEECTEIIGYDNIWTFEDIEYPVFWESVDPGPPAPGLCGYTWEIPAEYGGPGGGDYEDLVHLFYTVEAGFETILVWHPEEFNQVITSRQTINHEGGAMKAIYDYDGSEYNGWWDTVDQTGFLGACGSFVYQGSFTKRKSITDDSMRKWGNIWGNYWFSQEDMPPTADFPYLEHPEGLYVENIVETSYIRFLTYDGVYVKDRDDLYIYGSARRSNIGNTYGYRYMKREEVKEERFDGSVVLTDRCKELMEGNESVSGDWKYDSFTDIYYIEQWRHRTPPGEIVINIGGEEHVLFSEYAGPDIIYNDMTSNRIASGVHSDVGIFAKDGAGVEGYTIKPEEIDPVYVFNAVRRDEDGNDIEIMYGMYIDGTLYKSDFFPTVGGLFSFNINGTIARDNVRAGIIKERFRIEYT